MTEKIKVGLYVLLMLWEASVPGLLGDRCAVCGERVFPKDANRHAADEHPEEAA